MRNGKISLLLPSFLPSSSSSSSFFSLSYFFCSIAMDDYSSSSLLLLLGSYGRLSFSLSFSSYSSFLLVFLLLLDSNGPLPQPPQPPLSLSSELMACDDSKYYKINIIPIDIFSKKLKAKFVTYSNSIWPAMSFMILFFLFKKRRFY